MSTPEKPRLSFDDTLAHIDAVIAEPISMPPCLVCARAALLGSAYCAAHKPIPREMIEDLGPDAVVVEHRRSCTHDGPASTDCPGCAAVDADLAAAKAAATPAPAGPGWLARTLHRLFS